MEIKNGLTLITAEYEKDDGLKILVAPYQYKVFAEEGEYYFIPPPESEKPSRVSFSGEIFYVDMLKIKGIPLVKNQIKVIESSFFTDINDWQESPKETIMLFRPKYNRSRNYCFIKIRNNKKEGMIKFLGKKYPEFIVRRGINFETVIVSAPEEVYYNFYNFIIEAAETILKT